MIKKTILHFGKNLNEARHERTSVVCSKIVGGGGVGVVYGGRSHATSRKLCSFYPRLSWLVKSVFSN